MSQTIEKYDEYDVVITECDEPWFYWEAVKWGLKIKERATKKVSEKYRKEYLYHQTTESEQP